MPRRLSTVVGCKIFMMFRSTQNQRIRWQWDGATIELDADWCGQGPTILLLPALSSISTRHEMRPLQERLSAKFRTVSIDWPGFGDRPRPALDWRPEIYRAFIGLRPARSRRGRPRCDLRACPCVCLSKLSWTACSRSANLVRATANDNEWPPAAVRSHMPIGRSAGRRSAYLRIERQSSCHSPHGCWSRLLRSSMAARRAYG